ncbi:MAG: ATP-dependent Clp protease ATP-binding subunit [Verrucomicrobia bacterium]|nr:ATP-dependent Clp protease ATP-binding subunit [Verrucomicrobiota bacterium]
MEPMNNFTPRAQQVLALARKEADRFHHNYVGTEHLLLGLINLGQGVAVNVLQKMGLDLETVRNAVEKQVGTGPSAKPTGNIPYTPRVKKVLALAGKEAKALNHSYVGTEHILLGLLREGEGVAARVLKSLDVDIERCREEILSELDPNFTGEPSDQQQSGAPTAGASAGSAPSGDERREIKTPALKAFGRDLTELARNGELDPVIGRKAEIRRVIQILCRRTKNNPVLIGEAGVGKTAIAEGLALEIANGLVPEILADKRLITLDLALMVAGTKYRGQFEERIKAVMDEIKRARNIIIFIDELHTIVGAGAAEGAMDASNIFKPALSRGELQCIGATTLAEYRKYIEKDSALDRRFQSVMVEAPSAEDAIEILKGIAHKYEEHHKVSYSSEALESAVRLSERYITSRFLPDKAIDVLDEAGARARINSLNRPPEIDKMDQEIEAVCVSKEEAISSQKFEDAAFYRDREKTLRQKRDEMLDNWKRNRAESVIAVGEEDMLQVVSDWTRIPLKRMERKESQKLLELESDLQKAIIGQNEATIAIAKALRRSRADLKDPRRPIGSFLFMGPTGVGKTHLAKTLAEMIFGDRDSIVQIDMSEYMEKFSVSRLIGSPPGYVGYDEGGQLTEAVRRRPYCVVLFDEIEKAHPDVVQILLQVLEEGRLTDSLGRTVDFRNTIIIMTSNVGAHILQRNQSLGFGDDNVEDNFDKVKGKILEEAKRVFKPEFLNRISSTVVFRQLDRESLRKIVSIEIRSFSKRIEDRGLLLEVAPDAEDFLIDNGFDEKFGARPLRRAVEQFLEDPLAEALLRGDIREGEPIQVTVAGDKKSLLFNQEAPAAGKA